MTMIVRNIPADLTAASVAGFNALKRELAATASKVHADVTCKDDSTGTAIQITAADGSGTLGPLLTLCADIKLAYETHLADAVAHKTADAAPALTAATDLTSAQTLLNAIKADYNTHRASTTYHYTADATYTITSADATNQASADTLANELKADLNSHISAAFATRSIKVVAP